VRDFVYAVFFTALLFGLALVLFDQDPATRNALGELMTLVQEVAS
jgi:hypothetical protein